MAISNCDHRDCSITEKVNVPVALDLPTTVEPHTWCVKCGAIKNQSQNHGKKIGYFINALSEMRKRKLIVSQAQKRLIAQDLKKVFGFL